MQQNTRLTVVLLIASLAALSGCARDRLAKNSGARLDDRFESQISMARLSERHGDVQQAQAIYQAVIAKQYNNQLAHHRLAVLAAQNRQVDEANYHFREALAAGPASSELLNDYGYYLYLQQRLDEAETQFRQSLAQNSVNQSAHNNLGLVLGEQGRFDEALKEFQLAGSEATAHANLAYVYSLNGELNRAEQEYHHALALDETLKPAAEALLQLATRPRPPRPAETAAMTASYNNPSAGTAASQPIPAGTQRPTPGPPPVATETQRFATAAQVARQAPSPPAALQHEPPHEQPIAQSPHGQPIATMQPQPAPTVVTAIQQPTPPALTEFRPPPAFRQPTEAGMSVLAPSSPPANLQPVVTVGDRTPDAEPPIVHADNDSSIAFGSQSGPPQSLPQQPRSEQPRVEPPVVDYTTRLADRQSVFTPPQTDNSQQQPWTWQPPYEAAQEPATNGQ